MALQGVNYAKTVAVPQEFIEPGDHVGKVRCLYDEHTFAADVNGVGETILMGGKLPPNARILDAIVKCPSLGTTGIFKLGYSGDDDYFIPVAQLDAGGQAVLGKATAASAGLGNKLDEEVQPLITFTEATDNAQDVKLQMWILFSLD